jgi:hypothetical protein
VRTRSETFDRFFEGMLILVAQRIFRLRFVAFIAAYYSHSQRIPTPFSVAPPSNISAQRRVA